MDGKYVVVSKDENLSGFEKEVNAYIEQGYLPIGGVSVTSYNNIHNYPILVHTQALLKKELVK